VSQRRGQRFNLPNDLPAWVLPVYFAVLAVVLFIDALVVLDKAEVPVMVGSDLRGQYAFWREFGFGQIRAGHFPLWNPYVFCGTPFFGDPQSALLYPPNWLHLLLPPYLAFSWLFAIHIFLAGWLMAVFCRRREISVTGALIAGTVYACCGPIVANTMAGHLPLICSAAWLPGLWICIDAVFDAGPRRWRWTLPGMAVVAMLALDGYPQFAYYSTLAAILYTLLRLSGAAHRWQTIGPLTAMFIGGWMLSAVQILTSAQVAGESMRSGGLPFDIASSFSLPPENLLTLILPGVFGDAVRLPYFGRWYFWEATLYVGPAAAVLALCGAIFSPPKRRQFAGVMIFITLLLALGSYTPLYRLLYFALPGYASFRGANRFGLISLLFIAMLAGLGFDEVIRAARSRRFLLFLVVAAVILGAAAVWAGIQQASAGGEFATLIDALKMPQIPDSQAGMPADGATLAAGVAAREVAGASVVILAMAMALWARSRLPIAILAILLPVAFALHERVANSLSPEMSSAWSAALERLAPDTRVLMADDFLANAGAGYGFVDMRGFNPLVLGRFGRLMAAAHDADPDFVGLYLDVTEPSPVDRLCRCGLLLNGFEPAPRPGALPQLVLMGQALVAPDSASALKSVADPAFDPARSIVLEQQPDPAPQSGDNPGTARVISESTDSLEIVADLRLPQILLVTDAFSTGWTLKPIEPGPQPVYRYLAGDYAFRAIPLAAGHHHFMLEYLPTAYVVGKWISLCALGVYGSLLVWILYGRR
jgi:hypothetical protein